MKRRANSDFGIDVPSWRKRQTTITDFSPHVKKPRKISKSVWEEDILCKNDSKVSYSTKDKKDRRKNSIPPIRKALLPIRSIKLYKSEIKPFLSRSSLTSSNSSSSSTSPSAKFSQETHSNTNRKVISKVIMLSNVSGR